MIIYNITFVVHPDQDADFLAWMRSSALPALVNEASPARSPRLTRIADVPGDPEYTRQASTYALQLEFESISIARKWAEIALQPVTGHFTAKFGEERAVAFTTLLEVIDL